MNPEQALAFVAEHGVVLESASGPVPSVAQAVAGEAIAGSWWGHPAGRAIFAACEALRESPEVLTCKLVAGRVSYVHRRLWAPLAALAAEIGPERLARVDSVHTPSGKHESRRTPFPDWLPAADAAAATRLTPGAARTALGGLADLLLG